LHFRFTGSSYTLQSISFQAPFDSWYFSEGNFSSLVYLLSANGESSGDVTLRFAVGNVASQSYSGSFSVVAVDAFGVTHTSSGTITAGSASSIVDIKAFFIAHPLYLVLIAVVAIVLLIALVKFSKRRQ
jgi:hypothetical protein